MALSQVLNQANEVSGSRVWTTLALRTSFLRTVLGNGPPGRSRPNWLHPEMIWKSISSGSRSLRTEIDPGNEELGKSLFGEKRK